MGTRVSTRRRQIVHPDRGSLGQFTLVSHSRVSARSDRSVRPRCCFHQADREVKPTPSRCVVNPY